MASNSKEVFVQNFILMLLTTYLFFLNLCIVSNMFPFDIGNTDLRTNLFKGGRDDVTLTEPTDHPTKDILGWKNDAIMTEPMAEPGVELKQNYLNQFNDDATELEPELEPAKKTENINCCFGLH